MEYTEISIEAKLKETAEKTEAALEQYFKDGWGGDTVLAEAMQYSLLGGGKRIRAFLVLEFCRLFGGTEKAAMPYACALEMVHAYSLIHDDLPCMDNDDMRRGKPSNHKVYGETMALLAGDGLLTKAFETLSCEAAEAACGPAAVTKAVRCLSARAGDNGMVGGQVIDLSTEHTPDVGMDVLQKMDEGKTVALIAAACAMGCIAAGAGEEQLRAAETYAWGVGMAFQIRDDILDVIGDSAALGKNTGADAQNGRRNYVSLLGIEKAQSLVEEYTDTAIRALDAFDGDSTYLADYARRLAGRMH